MTLTRPRIRGTVGEPVERPDGVPKVTGEFEYASDLWLRGMLHGATLRSPHPHARIVSIDTAKARRLAGVRAVLFGLTFLLLTAPILFPTLAEAGKGYAQQPGLREDGSHCIGRRDPYRR